MNSLAEEMEDRYCGELSSASTVLEVPAFAGRKKITGKRLSSVAVACYPLSTREEITATGD